MNDKEKIADLESRLAVSSPKFREPDCGSGFYQCNRCDGMIGNGDGAEIYYPPNHYHHWCKCYDTTVYSGSADSYHRGKDVLK